MQFDIPDPVFTVEIVSTSRHGEQRNAYGYTIYDYRAAVMVGNVEVFVMHYDDDDSRGPFREDDRYVYDSDDVRPALLRAFGEKLKELLDD